MDDIHTAHVKHKPSSPTLSTFAPSKILPYRDAFGDPPDEYTVNKIPQIDSASQFASHEQAAEYEDGAESDDHRPSKRFSTDELTAYDLQPPPPTLSDTNAEHLTDRLYSADHLNVILKDPAHFQRFRGFLNRYRPQSIPTLVRYLESQKALTAVRYANALADHISYHSRQSSRSSFRSEAAMVDSRFESLSKKAVDELVTDALPAYVTFRMVTVVTECLVKEITGNNTPLMKEMVQGLAEVYCMTDPNQPDDPIVFASEEFYNTTQYGREYVIGKNCRFLQGPKTQRTAVKRISTTLQNGQEISEILLNYRRDGSPFLNLVMMAPLMDHHGRVRYFIGAQIDISHLLEGGRGLESFKQLLDQDHEATGKEDHGGTDEQRPSLRLLRELGGLLNDEEIEAVRPRRNSIESNGSTPTPAQHGPTRRYVGMDEPTECNIWPPSQFGPSGRLPGVYQNYLLVRPYPSLRIIFTSAALRIPGLSQSKLMDRIGGPQHVREGVLEALAQGVGVTAKISWLTHGGARGRTANGHHYDNNDAASLASEHSDVVQGKPRWIHCTPLLGSDAKPGVIMIVMVDKEEITGTLNPLSHPSTPHRTRSRQVVRNTDYAKEVWPLRGLSNSREGAAKYSGSKLYAEYLRREGRRESSEEERFAVGGGGRGDAGVLGSLQSPAPSGRSAAGRSTPGFTRRSGSLMREGRETA